MVQGFGDLDPAPTLGRAEVLALLFTVYGNQTITITSITGEMGEGQEEEKDSAAKDTVSIACSGLLQSEGRKGLCCVAVLVYTRHAYFYRCQMSA